MECKQAVCESGGFSVYISSLPFSYLYSHTTSMPIFLMFYLFPLSSYFIIPLLFFSYSSTFFMCDCHFRKIYTYGYIFIFYFVTLCLDLHLKNLRCGLREIQKLLIISVSEELFQSKCILVHRV